MPTDHSRNALAQQWYPLACREALRLWRSSATVRRVGTEDDARQEAFLAALLAAERFDPRRRRPFAAYLKKCVRGHLITAGRSVGLVRVPDTRTRRAKEMAFRALVARPLAATVAEGLQSREPAPSEAEEKREQRTHLRAALASMPTQSQQLLTRRFALDGAKRSTLAEVGALLGLTTQRVHQLQVSAIEDLRGRLTWRLEAHSSF